MGKPIAAGMETLHTLKSTDPPLWLAPSPNLSDTARKASQHLFSCLKPHAPKSPFDKLLVDGFDGEQIWQQIDLLSQPLLSNLRRQVKYFEKYPEEIGLISENKENGVLQEEKETPGEKKKEHLGDSDEYEMDIDEFDGEDDEEEEEGEKSGSEEEGSEDEEEELGEGKTGVEDKFLKINELEEYMEEDEAREYGLDKKKKKKGEQKKNLNELDEEEDEDEEGEGDEDEDDEFDSEDADGENLDNARYEDFFGSKKTIVSKRKSKVLNGSDSDSGLGSGSDDEQDDEQDDERMDKKENGLSTHEKQLQKLQSEIEQMEKANLEPKTWTMQGEVTAASRPKNSALEVDLDFEHNVRPAPVITEEVTQSIEDMIKDRIIEGRFDDIYKAPSLPATAPRELKEMDENKSKKGLAEVYEEEYVQKTNPAAAPLTFSDERKKEASLLFKQLCLKLDALSHFHFAPKPVIEDMSIQANVPALAMEEIAPMAVSDAAMLAPEEVFSSKGNIKEAGEMTQEDRKRRRAKKKRKFKAESAKKVARKPRADTTLQNDINGEEE
ncbi:M phase phosphoprotein 10 [Euphorbia lathyris]|uniref:M phase phosphoprotein 10 n=1 Tax=Euphorbia lathyris TaxID=212925 RepID=UPI0033131970